MWGGRPRNGNVYRIETATSVDDAEQINGKSDPERRRVGLPYRWCVQIPEKWLEEGQTTGMDIEAEGISTGNQRYDGLLMVLNWN
jgi:hypothetical protein